MKRSCEAGKNWFMLYCGSVRFLFALIKTTKSRYFFANQGHEIAADSVVNVTTVKYCRQAVVTGVVALAVKVIDY